MVGTEVKRDAGAGGWLVASETTEGVWYEVRLAPESCTCKGFEYRGRCKHLGMVEAMFAETPVDLEEPEAWDEVTWDNGEIAADEDEDAAEFDESEVLMTEVYSAQGTGASVTAPTPVGMLVASTRNPTTTLNCRVKEPAMSTAIPVLPDMDDEMDLEDRRWAHYCAVAKRLDAGDLINLITDEIAGEIGETPISALVEGWLHAPEPDWGRPLLSQYYAERIGTYVASIAAKIMEREIDRAVDRSHDIAF
jgi:hypothetical protein